MMTIEDLDQEWLSNCEVVNRKVWQLYMKLTFDKPVPCHLLIKKTIMAMLTVVDDAKIVTQLLHIVPIASRLRPHQTTIGQSIHRGCNKFTQR